MTIAETIIKTLNLKKHMEGGYFSETYRSGQTLDVPIQGKRAASTAIYYLLTAETFSEMHRLSLDEIFHFYMGDPLEMLHLYPDGHGERVILGTELEKHMRPQVIVPAGVWQGARVIPDSKNGYTLMGTTVAPGFEYSDYQSGNRLTLSEQYPQYVELITELTSQ